MTTRARVYVLYGQGGFLTSIGMWRLAHRIAKLWPDSHVTTHSWKYPQAVIDDWHRMPPGLYKPILIGYSLGANEIPRIAYGMVKTEIELAVLYDPSQYGEVVHPFPPNIKRALLYHNIGSSGYGHLIVEGPQVERFDVDTSHLAVCFNETLHQKTLAAIAKLIGPSGV